ncbi:PREDICTED: uncharacterized protein LOC106749937, partial [Dinoponera quadriceps]|uniref:Uncharacterized protein LOC106749937 n=1 Tax=Dinoponera quadriceps TaxID=609295 RepID=A0A6P3Y3H4_DINQU
MNRLFGIQITLQMVTYFVLLTGLIYLQYNTLICLVHTLANRAIRLKLTIDSDIWLALLVGKLVSMNHVCESVSIKARKTKEVVHKLTNLASFAETRDEVRQK